MAVRSRWRRLRWRHRIRLSPALAVGTLVVAAGLALVGTGKGYPADRPRLQSGSAWLASSQVGQLTLLDGSSAEVAAQVSVASPGSHIDSVQQGANAYVVNQSTGTLRRINGATFEVSPPATPIPDATTGLQAFAGPDALYALDTRRGLLSSADAQTLAARSNPVSLAAQVTPGATTLDDAGRLWVLDNATGDLVWVERDGRRHIRRGAARPGGSMLTIADGAPVVVDTRARTAALLDADSGRVRHTLALDLRPDDRVQVSGSPDAARMYLAASRGVLVVCDLNATSCASAVPLGSGGDFGSPVESGGHVFVPDYTTGRVWIVDLKQSRVVAQPQVLSPSTHFQLLARDGVVFFNDPDSENAGVLRLDGGVQAVPKYDPKNPAKGLAGAVAAGGEPHIAAPAGDQTGNPPGDQTGLPVTPNAPSLPQPADLPPAADTTNNKPWVRVVLQKPRALVDENITLEAQAGGGPGPVQVSWLFGDGQSATGTRVTHHWAAASTYQVSASARFANGTTAAASVSVLVTATPPTTRTLTVQVTGKGTVTSQPAGISCPGQCSAQFVSTDTVTLTPAPAAGSQFATWGGACPAGATCKLVMDQDRTASATFTSIPITVSATVSAVDGTYSGACPPPKDATTYRATISVNRGPVTVTFRWTGSNGGDTDPSTQTLTFTGTGAQSRTVTHNESFYLPDKTVDDWIAVDLMTPVSAQSNHASYQLTCVPQAPPPPSVSVTVSALDGSYTGACPPPDAATTYRATFTVNGAMTVKFHWTSSNGGDSDPSTQTLTFTAAGTKSVDHHEHFYLPGTTKKDTISVVLESPVGGRSNGVPYTMTCT